MSFIATIVGLLNHTKTRCRQGTGVRTGSYVHDSSLFISESGRGGVSVYVREAVTIIAGYCVITFWCFPHFVMLDVSEGAMWVCLREICGRNLGSYVGVS